MPTLIVFNHIGGGNIERPIGVKVGLHRFWHSRDGVAQRRLDVPPATFLVSSSLLGYTVNRYNYPQLL